MSQDYNLINYLAIELLERLGNFSPSESEIEFIEQLISNAFQSKELLFNEYLTQHEAICLYLIARGKTTSEIAKFTKRSTLSVNKSYQYLREKICRYPFEKDVLERYCFNLHLSQPVSLQGHIFN